MDLAQIDPKQIDDIKNCLDKIFTKISDISEVGIKSNTMYHLDERFDKILSSLNKLVETLEKINYTFNDIKDKINNINSHLEKISYGIGDLDSKMH